MSRAKKGLDYFSVDVDMDQDDKICVIEAKHRDGFKIVIKLLMAIYREGYYKDWSGNAPLVFAARKGISAEDVQAVVQTGTEVGLFSPDMLSQWGILTSAGIQRRFVLSAHKRDSICLDTRYALVKAEEFPPHIVAKLLFSTESGPSGTESGYGVSARPTSRESKEREEGERGSGGERKPNRPPASPAGETPPAGQPATGVAQPEPGDPPRGLPPLLDTPALRAHPELARATARAHQAGPRRNPYAPRPNPGEPCADSPQPPAAQARASPPEDDDFGEFPGDGEEA